jgi:hypothetical protein
VKYLWGCDAVDYGFEWGNCRKEHEEEWQVAEISQLKTSFYPI